MYALENLTGGFGQFFAFENQGVPKDLYNEILRWLNRGAVVGVGTNTAVSLPPKENGNDIPDCSLCIFL